MPRLFIATVRDRKTGQTKTQNCNFSSEMDTDVARNYLERTNFAPDRKLELVDFVEAEDNSDALSNPLTAARHHVELKRREEVNEVTDTEGGTSEDTVAEQDTEEVAEEDAEEEPDPQPAPVRPKRTPKK